jgi:hypothetical protein
MPLLPMYKAPKTAFFEAGSERVFERAKAR